MAKNEYLRFLLDKKKNSKHFSHEPRNNTCDENLETTRLVVTTPVGCCVRYFSAYIDTLIVQSFRKDTAWSRTRPAGARSRRKRR